jgi:hypothetical protein
MTDTNPYAPPKAELVDRNEGKCSRDGKNVIVGAGGDLPPRCIVCNAPVAHPIKSKKLYWHSPWLYLLILINILVYAIAGLIARKSVKVSAGLCEAHEARRKRRLFVLIGIGVALWVIGTAFLYYGQGPAATGTFVLSFLSLIGAVFAGRKVYALKITDEYARLGGCKEPFLASLE